MTYGTIRFANGWWRLEDVQPHVCIRLKQVFKAVETAARPPFMLQDNLTTARDLQWFAARYPMTWEPAATARILVQEAAWQKQDADLEAIKAAGYTPPAVLGFKEPERARPHQARAAALLRQTGNLLLLDDVGLGKTVSALASVADGWGLPAAVVVMSNLGEQWIKGFINRFTHLRAVEIKDRKPRVLPPADIYVFRYSNVAAWVDMFEPMGIKTAIFDEVQELRHGSATEKGRAARVLAGVAQNRLGLTATPIYNYGGEIFTVVDLLAPGALGTEFEFRLNWCTYDGKGHAIVTDPAALGAFLQDQGLALRRTAETEEVAMSLPPLRKVVLEVDWNDGDVGDNRELMVSLARRVVTGGFTDRGKAARELDMLMRQDTGIAKAKSVAAYVRMLVDAGEPVLLAGWHRRVYEIWQKEMADLCPLMFTGSESNAQKRAAKDALISGKSKVLMMSLRSGAGLDGLQDVCCNAVIGELDWSPQVHRQFVGRIHRDGQTRDCTAHYLFTNGGSDPVVMSVNGLKASQSHGILNPWTEIAPSSELDEGRITQLARAILERQ